MKSMKLSRLALFNAPNLIFITGSMDVAAADGAISGNVKGITEVVRNGVGDYTIKFVKPVADKMCVMIQADGATAASGIMKVESAPIANDNEMQIILYDATGVAADVDENSKLNMFMVFQK